jgi:(S)-citramalyl-CoA lyase
VAGLKHVSKVEGNLNARLTRDGIKRPTRSWLFTPATKPERFVKAKEAGADVQIIDLEDSVSPAEKDCARRSAFDYLAERNPNGSLEALRVNAMHTQWGLSDLEALVQHEVEPEFVIIPKVESPNEITLVAMLLGGCGKSTTIVAMIESARAIAGVEQIVESNPRLSHLLFGSADLAAELKAENTWEALLYSRSRTVAGAALADLPVIDAPTFDLSSDDPLKADLRRVRALGFAGKAAIHPKQVAAINQFFTPSLEEITTAKHILEENLKGAGTVDGKMVDEAVARRARQVVAIARALGISF